MWVKCGYRVGNPALPFPSFVPHFIELDGGKREWVKRVKCFYCFLVVGLLSFLLCSFTATLRFD